MGSESIDIRGEIKTLYQPLLTEIDSPIYLMTKFKPALQQYFGFNTFRPGQKEVISILLDGHSAAAVFPTGAGKSLCYQLPALFAIDEVHCITEWGHYFRPDYLKLANFAQEYKAERVLVLALTATTIEPVFDDIRKVFSITPEHVIRTGLCRPNLATNGIGVNTSKVSNKTLITSNIYTLRIDA